MNDAARVLGRYETKNGVVLVLYEAAGATFRARLRPDSNGEVLTLSRLAQVEDANPDAAAVEHHSITHVPPVVRGAVDRPVQVSRMSRGFTGP